MIHRAAIDRIKASLILAFSQSEIRLFSNDARQKYEGVAYDFEYARAKSQYLQEWRFFATDNERELVIEHSDVDLVMTDSDRVWGWVICNLDGTPMYSEKFDNPIDARANDIISVSPVARLAIQSPSGGVYTGVIEGEE